MKRFFRSPVFLSFLLTISILPLSTKAGDTKTQIFDSNFKTLRCVVNDNFMLSPVIRLNSSDVLTVSFDEIADDYRELQYRLIHCNADWQPSALVESEYLDSFNFADIEDYAFSSNTFVRYVNYQIRIPDDRMQPLVSGNYLLQVFDRYNPDDVILQTRFYVAENSVLTAGTVSTRTDRSFNDTYQQLDIAIDNGNDIIPNPYQDVMVIVTQNRRPETSRAVMNPFRVQGKEILFEHNRDLIFPASNEYRRFETVRVDYPGMHIDSVAFMGTNHHAWLMQEASRTDASYNFDSTQFGRFFIREHNSTDSDLGADYVTVHFSLDYPESDLAEIYLDGDFVEAIPLQKRRMLYDSSTGLYSTQLPLKQGAYNYQYVRRMPDGSLSTSLVEGDKYETCNEYLVNVYLRTPGARADRLIGSTTIYSR